MKSMIWMPLGMSLLFGGLGLFGLIRRKPFVFSNYWFFAMVLLVVGIPLTLLSAPLGGIGHRMIGLSPLLLFGICAMISVMHYRSHILMGMTDTALRDGLTTVLTQYGLPFEISLARVILPSLDGELRISLQEPIGVGQIKAKGIRDRTFMPRLARDLNAYFLWHDVPTRLTGSFLYLFLGLFMLFPLSIFGMADREFMTTRKVATSAQPDPSRLSGRAKALAEHMWCPCGCDHMKVVACQCSTSQSIKKRLRATPMNDRSDEDIMQSLNKEFCMVPPTH